MPFAPVPLISHEVSCWLECTDKAVQIRYEKFVLGQRKREIFSCILLVVGNTLCWYSSCVPIYDLINVNFYKIILLISATTLLPQLFPLEKEREAASSEGFYSNYLIIALSVWNGIILTQCQPIQMDTVFITMINPLLYRMSIANLSFRFCLFSYLISIVFLAIYASHSFTAHSFIVYSFISVLSGKLLCDFEKSSLVAFMSHEVEAAATENMIRSNESRYVMTNIAHDLKTPLFSFRLGLELVGAELQRLSNATTCSTSNQHKSGDGRDEELTHNHLMIQSINSHLKDIMSAYYIILMSLNRYTDFSKLSEGIPLVPQYGKIDLSSLVDSCINCVKDLSTRSNRVEILVEDENSILSSNLSTVVSDSQWLHDNLLCLLTNATKHCRRTVKLKLSTVLAGDSDHNIDSKDLELKKSFIRFEVYNDVESDVQISDDVLLQMFIAHASRGRDEQNAGGSGIGLYCLSKRIKVLGGECGATNSSNSFSVWFTLSLNDLSPDIENEAFSKDDEQEKCANNHSSNMVRSTSNNSFRLRPCGSSSFSLSSMVPKKSYSNDEKENINMNFSIKNFSILIIDDSQLILKLCSVMLRKVGHNILTAENGLLGLMKFNECNNLCMDRPIEIILTDIDMPVLGGKETIRRIRSYESYVKQLANNYWASMRYDDDYQKMIQKILFNDNNYNNNNDGNDTTTNNNNEKSFEGIEIDNIPSCSRRIIVIGMSANSDDEIVSEAYKAGFDAFLAKPFNYDAFKQILDSLTTTLI
eukprot:gene11766-15744_t